MAIRSKLVLIAAASLLIAASTAFAQIPQPTPEPAATVVPAFEVISVKEDKAAQSWHEGITADGYSAKGITLELLLMGAYGIRPDYRLIGAPKWWNDNRFDIEAKVSDADVAALQKLGYRQRAEMVQQILADRFKLKAHLETRTEPIYSLVVAKPGALTEASPSPDGKPIPMGLRPGRGARAGQMVATEFTMPYLASQFSGMMGRMVVDNTGLTGEYHGDLHWTPGNGPAQSGVDPAPDNELSIFTALQEQLGLKLVPAKGPVDCLVIDHVEMPSEN